MTPETRSYRVGMRSGLVLSKRGLLVTALTLAAALAWAAPAQAIHTVAGNGSYSYFGDGGPATLAGLTWPLGVAVGADGDVYLALPETPSLRRVTPDGTISAFAGNGTFGFSGDGGPATSARLSGVEDVAVGPDGSVFFADSYNNRIRRVAPDGTISTVAGSGPVGNVSGFGGDGGPATGALLDNPVAVAVAPNGTLFISDGDNYRIRKVTPGGTISTIAGNGVRGFSGDGGPATSASIDYPHGLAATADGAVYLADVNNNRVRRIAPDGTISTVAGNGVAGFGGDGGPATAASLNAPIAVAPSADGGLFISDTVNNRIRRLAPDGTISTIGGGGSVGEGMGNFAGDGGPLSDARLNAPTGLAIGPDGTLYIADAYSFRIRAQSPPPHIHLDNPGDGVGGDPVRIAWTLGGSGAGPAQSMACTLDGAARPCAMGDGSLLLDGLAPGAHTFTATVSGDGNTDADTVSWTTSEPPASTCFAPQITGVEPAAPMPGERVVVTGSGFGATGTLSFGTVRATSIETWSPTVIAAQVPAGAGAGVTVLCANGSSSSTSPVTIAPVVNQEPVAVIDDLGTAAKPVLDSSGSYDPDGVIARRTWTAGRKKLSTKTIAKVSLKAGQRLKVTLTVQDKAGASDATSITLKAPRKKPRKPVTVTRAVSLNAQVLFGVGRAGLTTAGAKAVRRLRALAAKSSKIVIAGFASQDGPADYNLTLSRDRADSVRTALLTGLKTKAKVTIVANGESGRPRERETGPRARQMNRKVIVTLTYKTANP